MLYLDNNKTTTNDKNGNHVSSVSIDGQSTYQEKKVTDRESDWPSGDIKQQGEAKGKKRKLPPQWHEGPNGSQTTSHSVTVTLGELNQ